MELTYKLDEAGYLRAMKLGRTADPALRIAGTIYVCLALVALAQFAILPVCILAMKSFGIDSQLAAHLPPTAVHRMSLIEWAIAGVLGAILYLKWIATPEGLRKRYRGNPNFQVTRKMKITFDSVSQESSHGASSSYQWRCFRFWREEKGMLLLSQRWGGQIMVDISGLSEMEHEELITILSTALPRKK